MAKQTETGQKRSHRITMPDVVDLSIYNRLDVTFTNGKDELFNIQFQREIDGSGELHINTLGPTGEITTTLTLFDLEV